MIIKRGRTEEPFCSYSFLKGLKKRDDSSSTDKIIALAFARRRENLCYVRLQVWDAFCEQRLLFSALQKWKG